MYPSQPQPASPSQPAPGGQPQPASPSRPAPASPSRPAPGAAGENFTAYTAPQAKYFLYIPRRKSGNHSARSAERKILTLNLSATTRAGP